MPLKYLRFVISYFLWSVNRARNPSPSPFTLQGGTTVINVLGREEPSHLPLESYIVRTDCKTVGFFTKSVKKSVKRPVRVLHPEAREPHTPVGRMRREILASLPRSRSLFSASFQTFCLTTRAYLNTQKYGLFCSLVRTQHACMKFTLGSKFITG